MSTKSFIVEYPDIFTKSMCQELIDQFEEESDKVYRDSTNSIRGFGDSRKAFTEMALPQQYNQQMQSTIMSLYYNYMNAMIPYVCLPERVAVEGARMKRYDTGEEFGWHSDVGDKLSATRILVMMAYLNDDFEGGETEFLSADGEVVMKPEAGKVVVFPATFTFPHRGRIITSGSKYIVNQYIHYT